MKKQYVIAHDLGTSSDKAVLIDTHGAVLCDAVAAYDSQYPNPGWVEQQPEDYWNAVTTTTCRLMQESGIDAADILGIVYTTQAMGVIPIDAEGNVLRPNITWVDGRAEEQAGKIMRLLGGRALFKSIIGIEITGKDVLPKLLWIKQNEPEIYKAMDKVLDVNGWLKFRSTGKKVFEWSGACSYTFDLKKKDWTRILFRAIGFDLNKLPDLVRSIDVVGGLTKRAAAELGLNEGTPVFGGCDDTQSAAIGSSANNEGEAHIYLGTSAWVGVMTKRAPRFKHGAVTLQSADPAMNLVVGITESAGANFEWLIEHFYKSEQRNPSLEDIFTVLENDAAKVPPGSDHLIITPWMLGERCPVSTTTTRGTIFNISLEHTRGHFVRALSEGIACNLRWIIENFEKDFGFDMQHIRVTGGGSKNRPWMQILADVTQRQIVTTNQPKMAGAIGAAMVAFVGAGVYKDFSSIKQIILPKETFAPNKANKEIYDELFINYKRIYSSLRNTYRQANQKRFAI